MLTKFLITHTKQYLTVWKTAQLLNCIFHLQHRHDLGVLYVPKLNTNYTSEIKFAHKIFKK